MKPVAIKTCSQERHSALCQSFIWACQFMSLRSDRASFALYFLYHFAESIMQEPNKDINHTDVALIAYIAFVYRIWSTREGSKLYHSADLYCKVLVVYFF